MPKHSKAAGDGADLAVRSPLSFAIRRVAGKIVVTVRGEVDRSGVEGLAGVLRDLIDNQGNGTVVVDLRHVAGVDPSLAEVFSAASAWARRHGAKFGLHDPPPALVEVLDPGVGVERRIARHG